MKKIRLLSMITMMLMLLQLLSGFAFAQQQTSVPDGYIGIYNAEDMELMREDTSGKFILMNDIVFDDPEEQYGYKSNFETIYSVFSGELDGNGYAIKNIYTNGSIFSNVEGGYIHDITVEGYSTDGGVIAWQDYNCKYENVAVYGEVSYHLAYSTAEYIAIGGMVGETTDSEYINCRNYANVTIYQYDYDESADDQIVYIGGIVGSNYCGYFEGCINYGTIVVGVDTPAVIGGIAGDYLHADINRCINYGTLMVDQETVDSQQTVFAGGIVGIISDSYSWDRDLSDCYNAGFFDLKTGYTLIAGGLCGRADDVSLYHNYNIATVYNGAVAGLVGDVGENVTVEKCLFTEGYSSAYGDSESTDGMVSDGVEYDFNVFYQDGEGWSCDFEADYPYPYLTDIGVAMFRGSGTQEDPYLISDYNELNMVRNCLSAHFKVSKDIQQERKLIEAGWGVSHDTPFYPIGNYYDEAFSGVFDGDGHTINVNTSWKDEHYANYVREGDSSEKAIQVYMGLFSSNEGTIKNLTVSSEAWADTNCIEITGFGIFPKYEVFSGNIAGYNSGTIERCNVVGGKGVVVGGVAADNNGIIQDCKIDGLIIASSGAGGVAAVNTGNIKRCAVTSGYVSKAGPRYSSQRHSSVAGIAANNSGGTIEDCYSTALAYCMSTDTWVLDGGAAGIAWGGTIKRCYCTAQSEVVYDHYSAAVTGKIEDLKIEIGSGTITDCYVFDPVGNNTESNALTFEKMKNQTSFKNFDFSNVWIMSDKSAYPFPILRGQENSINYGRVIGAQITKLPDRLNYAVGEEIDYTGFEMVQYFTNGTKNKINDSARFLYPKFKMDTASISLSDIGPFTKSGSRIGIVYDLSGHFCPIPLSVNVVSEKKVESIDVSAPAKLIYCKGDKLDLTGMVVKADYNTDQIETVTEGYTVTGFDSSVLGTQTVTVTFGEKSDTFEVTVSEHNTSDLIIVSAPTCIAEGTGYKECTLCHSKLEENIRIPVDPSAHKWESEYTVDIAAGCGKTGSKSIYCELCDAQKADSVTIIPATGEHVAGELVIDKMPTCTEQGSGHKDCITCGKPVQSNIGLAVDPDAHKWESEYTIDEEATCGADGSKSIYCELCNAQKADSVTVIPATGKHTAGELVIDTESTCSAVGSGHKDCTVCGKTAQGDIVIAVDPDAHKWEAEYTIDVPATCGRAGSKSIYCEYCDKQKNDSAEVIPATGAHSAAEEITPVIPATCGEAGVGKKLCTVCGKDAVTNIVIPATGEHVAGAFIVDTPASCSEKGVGHRDCTVCGKLAEGNIEIVMDPEAHKWEKEYTIDVAATCGADGSKSIYCELCNTQKAGSVTVIPATGKHTAGELITDTAPTCSATGLGHKDCTVCGQIAESQVEIAIDPAAHTGNNHTENTKSATCTELGYTGDTVCECGVKIASGEEIAKAPHTAGAWKTVKEPTTSKTGLKEQRCKVCNTLLDSKTIAKKKPAVNFVDVKKSDFFYDAVAWAVAEGVTTGTSPTTFGPDEACTRAQAVTFLWRAAGCPAPKSGNNPFVDVKKSDYFYKAVLWAAGSGVTAGTSKTEFSPEETCTRGQIVTFLWRAQSGKKVSASNPFKDVKKSDFYYNAVLWAVKNGVTTGTSSTTFGPSEDCTRGQIVTFLYRAMV